VIPARINRRTFAIWTVIYILVYAGANLAAKPYDGAPMAIGVVGPLIWALFLGGPRFRDFGMTGWLACIPFVVGFVAGFASGARLISAADLATVRPLIGLGAFVFMILLALIPGAKGENRFGRRQGEKPGGIADTFA